MVGKIKLGMEKDHLSRRQAIIHAIDWCINGDIMKNYLSEKKDAVFTMLDFQWDLDEAKIAWQNKTREDGRNEERYSIALNLLKMGMTLEKIHEATKLSVEKIKELGKNKIDSEKTTS